jgi:hypothetical protein
MLPPFGSDGHFLIGSADSIPMWAPLVGRFLERNRNLDGWERRTMTARHSANCAPLLLSSILSIVFSALGGR